MNLDEKTEIDFAADGDQSEDSPKETKPHPEQTGKAPSCTDAEPGEEETPDEGYGPEPQSAPSGAGGR